MFEAPKPVVLSTMTASKPNEADVLSRTDKEDAKATLIRTEFIGFDHETKIWEDYEIDETGHWVTFYTVEKELTVPRENVAAISEVW